MYQVSKGFQNTLNPTDYWNPNSRLESSTWNPEFVVWNPESKTGLDSLTSGKDMAKYSYRERSIVLCWFISFSLLVTRKCKVKYSCKR